MTHPKPVESVDGDIAATARARHTAKAYREDALSEKEIANLLDLLRFSASSTNSQPWHFVVATTRQGRDRIARAGTDDPYPFNSDAVRQTGMVVVFAARLDADAAYLDHLLEREDADGRFPEPEQKAKQREGRAHFVDLNRTESDPGAHDWMARQTYWNGGQFLLGAAAMGLDATPMEGIDTAGLDREFDLPAKGYTALFVITVGRNKDGEDWNFHLPKSRLPLSEIATRI